MHVVQVSFFVDPEARTPARQLDDWPALAQVALATAEAGPRVSVVQASATNAEIRRNDVTFHFVAPRARRRPFASDASVRALLGDLSPDLFHVHGLGFPQEVLALHESFPEIPILLQDHADRVPPVWNRRAWRRAATIIAGIAFCAREQAEPFVRAGLLPAAASIFEIPESTSSFTPGDRAAAREATGLQGDPCALWVGHLNANKDPLTVLEGISLAAESLENLQLWCCFARAPQLNAVQRRIRSDPRLRHRVNLLGKVSHARVEMLMRAADIFVLGSYREGCNFSVIEALATGLTPVVTDIPSMRSLTGDNGVAELWHPGDSHALSDALTRAARKVGERSRAATRSHFEQTLAAGALGRRLASTYASLL